MAIKIIKRGKKPDTTKRFECDYCGCTFEGRARTIELYTTLLPSSLPQ